MKVFEQVSSLGDQMSLLDDPCTVNSHVGGGGATHMWGDRAKGHVQ